MNPSSNWEHEKFLELCAALASGEIAENERQELEQHLSTCTECRNAIRQFEVVVGEAIPAIASEYLQHIPISDASWSLEKAEADFFQRISREEDAYKDGEQRITEREHFPSRIPLSSSTTTWNCIWATYAACILLVIALGVCVYQYGVHRGTLAANIASPTGRSAPGQLSNAEREYALAQTTIDDRGRLITNLRRDLHKQSEEVRHLDAAQKRVESDLRETELERQKSDQERFDLQQKALAAQARMQNLQAQLDSAEKQASQEVAHAAASQAKVNELTASLKDSERIIDEQQELLAHDRDIRELMGARDLYIAEVYDVSRAGTQKPFGRVFYTKGKSLVFYAYDLDLQPGVKNASTFQAWGVRGPDRNRALSLGIFYQDNASKKRWVLRSADPRVLSEIDSIFVTVEPSGGSHKPSSKPLLFTYLKVNSNHP